MKAKVEWKDGEVWRQANVEVLYSQHNNYYFKYEGKIYVFPTLKENTQVIMKNGGGKWVKAGRVARGCIFLGEGMSYSETAEIRFQNQKIERPIFT